MIPWLVHFLQSVTQIFTSIKLGLNIFNFYKLVSFVTWKTKIPLMKSQLSPRISLTLLPNTKITRKTLIYQFSTENHPFSFLQNWTLTFQYSAKLVQCMAWKTELPLMKPQLNPGFSWSLLPNTKCPFLSIFLLDF